MEYTYIPKGVCSDFFRVGLSEEGVIESLRVEGGCEGNSTGISRLVKGRHIDEIIGLLAGVDCDGRGTSCPDQLAKMLAEIRAARAERD